MGQTFADIFEHGGRPNGNNLEEKGGGNSPYAVVCVVKQGDQGETTFWPETIERFYNFIGAINFLLLLFKIFSIAC